MWAAPAGLLIALVARRWAVAVSSARPSPRRRPCRQEPPNSPSGAFFLRTSSTTIGQANLGVGHADPDALVRLVRDHRVRLLATEELTDAEEQRLTASGLSTLLPYHFTAPLPDGGGGLGIWSRYPLTLEHNLPGYELGVLTRGSSARGAPFTAVAVHLPRPTRTRRTGAARSPGCRRCSPRSP